MTRINKRLGGIVALAVLTMSPIVLAGCGEPTEADPTPVKTWKITPAATGAAGQTSTPEPASTKAPAGTPSADGTTLELKGVSSTFDVTDLSAPAGPITIKFDNHDSGVVHNVAVYPGDDASEDPIGATELETGPIEQELKLSLESGEYFYQCDAHPTTMKGTLEVE